MPETTLTIVARRQPIGLPDDKRNRAWLHDGERWTRPDTLTLQLEQEAIEATVGSSSRYVPGLKSLHITAERRRWRGHESRQWVSRLPASINMTKATVLVYTCDNCAYAGGGYSGKP